MPLISLHIYSSGAPGPLEPARAILWKGGGEMAHNSRNERFVGRLPAGFYARPRLHLSWPGELEVENCKGILLCTEKTIRLEMGGRQAAIQGDGLRLLTLEKGRLRIRGAIISIEFTSGEAGEQP